MLQLIDFIQNLNIVIGSIKPILRIKFTNNCKPMNKQTANKLV